MFAPHPSHLPPSLRSPRNLAGVAVGTMAAAGIAWYLLTRPKPSPEEVEQGRRDLLSATGRITDGTITDVSPALNDPSALSAPPQTILYNYRIGGVSYECGQVVTSLAEHVRDLRIDLPIQVRYDPHNPSDSIVVSESWSGLRLGPHHPASDPSALSGDPAARLPEEPPPTAALSLSTNKIEP